tara:strand:- start:82 stop:453 length:372 start_codon:yes stop_codon:yes gene_type:complete
MALKPCRECGTEVSTEAETCPSCGVKTPTKEISQEWMPCKKCGSVNVNKMGPGLLGFIMFMMGSCCVWIPVIGWILAPVFFVVAIWFWISALLPSGQVMFQCKDCKSFFRVPKSELPEPEPKD